MLDLNFSNVEKMIFFDDNIKKMLHEFKDVFEKWKTAKLNFDKKLCQKILIDFLASLNKKHVTIIEKYLGTKIKLTTPIDYAINKNFNFVLAESENGLNFLNIENWNWCVSRNSNRLYISFWR